MEYQKGNYTQAIDIFSQLTQEPFVNGYAHFNLGNSYYRNNQIGRAIYHYLKAQKLKPRDPDIEFNLKYVRQKTKDQIIKPASFWNYLQLDLIQLNLKEKYILLLILFSLTGIFGLFAMFSKLNWTHWAQWIGLGLFILVFMQIIVIETYQKPFGVVVNDETKIYSSTGVDQVHLFSLNEGSEFTVIRKLNSGWSWVRLADNRQGWLKSDSILIE